MGLRSFQSRTIVSSGNSKVVSLLQNRVTFGSFQRCETLLHTFNLHSKELSETRARPMLSLSTTARITYAAAISKLFGVSEKAVRDIWTGKTWSKETWHLNKSRPFPAKKMGRPFGRKDAQPRKPRSLRTIIFRTLKMGPKTSSAWCLHDTSIDELRHEKTQCGFVPTFEDPFGPDWAGVLYSFQQSMRQLYQASRGLAHASCPKHAANVCLASYAEVFLSHLT